MITNELVQNKWARSWEVKVESGVKIKHILNKVERLRWECTTGLKIDSSWEVVIENASTWPYETMPGSPGDRSVYQCIQKSQSSGTEPHQVSLFDHIAKFDRGFGES